jgi:radical SAM superfamily enzyme YgiQ (UPF0313 family)
MRTDNLVAICQFARKVFPDLRRITVYGSSQYIIKKGFQGLKRLAEAGLSRIHLGLESGDDVILKRIQKGSNSQEHIKAGRWAMEAGIELSLYVILGIGGINRTALHAKETAKVLNAVSPDFIRLRTFVPKTNTPLLDDVQNGSFKILGPHEVLRETAMLLTDLECDSNLFSDHYTNYINLQGRLPGDKKRMLQEISAALERDERSFRSFFIGTQ